MSYCRWSTNDYQCDLYCYEGEDYVTHVASNRIVFNEPLPIPLPLENPGWLERHQLVSKIIEKSERVPIGLPYDGQSFHDDSPESFLETLLMLKSVGYRFPDAVIDAVKEEMETI